MERYAACTSKAHIEHNVGISEYVANTIQKTHQEANKQQPSHPWCSHSNVASNHNPTFTITDNQSHTHTHKTHKVKSLNKAIIAIY